MGMYKFNYSASQDGYDVDGNKLETIEDHMHDAAGNHIDETVTAITGDTINYLGSYTILDAVHGTEVTVTVDEVAGTRTMVSNTLPNHDIGEFPNPGNPNTPSAQERTNVFPLNPTLIGEGRFARQAGMALNGVKFEPQTAERLTCTTGEVYSIEALEGFLDFGVDENNAHVQPTGEYHYHGVSDNLVSAFAQGEDPVLVGFANDGFLMYYSPSGQYIPSMSLKTTPRTGSNCIYTNPGTTIEADMEGTSPDGSFVSDWEYVEGSGNLDECNGTVINGQYAYVITNEYPYVPRCLKGEFSETGGGGGQAGQGGPSGGGRPPGEGGPPRP